MFTVRTLHARESFSTIWFSDFPYSASCGWIIQIWSWWKPRFGVTARFFEHTTHFILKLFAHCLRPLSPLNTLHWNSCLSMELLECWSRSHPDDLRYWYWRSYWKRGKIFLPESFSKTWTKQDVPPAHGHHRCRRRRGELRAICSWREAVLVLLYSRYGPLYSRYGCAFLSRSGFMSSIDI